MDYPGYMSSSGSRRDAEQSFYDPYDEQMMSRARQHGSRPGRRHDNNHIDVRLKNPRIESLQWWLGGGKITSWCRRQRDKWITDPCSRQGFSKSNIANLVGRAIQIIFACAVIGLYAQDLNKARRENKYSDSKWVFAVVIGSLAAVTALAYAIIGVLSKYATIAILFAWDFILMILWFAVFGLFGSMYIHEKVEMQPGIQRMKNAVWIDLINALLWLVSACFALVYWLRNRQNRSLHTGRAHL